ncbi:MAG TPA: YihY/virulence factor BrkB family protein [Stellaceae bacterium]|jgi:membrane protein|nr:YihY/virulence factor BrkB family protein [Stellaceae bacterium]
MLAGAHDTKIIRDAKRAIATQLIPRARRWHEMVRREWWSILMAIGMRIGRDNVSLLAAGVAFYIFVAIPSALAAIVSVYGLMFNPSQVESQIVSLMGVLPADVITILGDFLQMLAAKPQSTLGLHLILGLAVAVWSAQSAASSMIAALDAAYEQKETRAFLRFQLAALILAACSIVFALASLMLFAVMPAVLDWVLPFADKTKTAINIFRWPALAVTVALAIAGIYRFAPAREGSRRPWGAWGVLLTTIVWIGSSALFGLYVSKVASYDASYGSLGAVVVLLLWLYIAVFVVLLGAELNAEIESRFAAGMEREERGEAAAGVEIPSRRAQS